MFGLLECTRGRSLGWTSKVHHCGFLPPVLGSMWTGGSLVQYRKRILIYLLFLTRFILTCDLYLVANYGSLYYTPIMLSTRWCIEQGLYCFILYSVPFYYLFLDPLLFMDAPKQLNVFSDFHDQAIGVWWLKWIIFTKLWGSAVHPFVW